jgi:hypothetical protein
MQLIAANAAGMVRDDIPMDPQIRRWVNARTCQLLTARSVVSALPAQIGLRYSVESFLGFGVATWQTMGSVVCLLAFAGLALELAAPLLDRRRPSAPAACMAGLLCGFLVLHCIVPAGVESRKLIVVLPAVLYFALTGAKTLVSASRPLVPVFSNAIPAMIILAALILTNRIGSIPIKPGYGLASGGLNTARGESSAWLASGTSTFEGAVVSEAAMLGHYQRHTVFRGFKVLADSDWNANNYKSHYHSVTDLKTMLEKAPVQMIAVETTAAAREFEHNTLLVQALNELPNLWRSVPQACEPGRCEIFVRTTPLTSAEFQDRLREMQALQQPGGL